MVVPPEQFPVPPELSAPRSAERRAASGRQTQGLQQFLERTTERRRRIGVLESRRAGRDDLVQFSRVDRGVREVLIERGALLALTRQLDAQDLTSVIEGAGWSRRASQILDGRVTEIRKDPSDVEEVEALRRRLTRLGVPTSFTAVVPSGINGKSGDTPESYAGPTPQYSAAAAGSVRVAVLDTGLYAGKRSDGWLTDLVAGSELDPLDAIPQPNTYLDAAAGHGSFAAGVVQQLAPHAAITVRSCMDSDGFGSEVHVAEALVQVVRDLLEADARVVVNLSLGTETVDDAPPLALEVALDLVEDLQANRGGEVLVVAAAGNEGVDRPFWPAAFDRVVAVGSLAPDSTPSTWSSRGAWVDCSAIGEGVVSTFVEGREDPALDPTPEQWGANAWAIWSGTSFTAPQIVGAVAFAAERDSGTLAHALQTVLAGSERIPGFGRIVKILG